MNGMAHGTHRIHGMKLPGTGSWPSLRSPARKRRDRSPQIFSHEDHDGDEVPTQPTFASFARNLSRLPCIPWAPSGSLAPLFVCFVFFVVTPLPYILSFQVSAFRSRLTLWFPPAGVWRGSGGAKCPGGPAVLRAETPRSVATLSQGFVRTAASRWPAPDDHRGRCSRAPSWCHRPGSGACS